MPKGHHKLCRLDGIDEERSIIPYKEFKFYNKRGDYFTYGSVIYYPMVDRNGYAHIRKNKIEAFAFVRGKSGESITPMVLTANTRLNLNDLYKTYEEAEEVINKWEEKIVNNIKTKITS